MLGLLITLLFGLGILLLTRRLLNRVLDSLHPLESLGVSGLVGLGLAGSLTFLVGLAPSGVQIVVPLLLILSLCGFVFGLKQSWQVVASARAHLTSPQISVLLLFGLITSVSAIAPSDMMEWDSLAYHLAVPKLWILSGQIGYVPTIHHSNFPFAADSLYILGLQWGGSSGAKSFTVLFYLFGAISIYGLLLRHKSRAAALWGTLAFMTVPVILWESGTAYIDVAHGLFAGIGLVYAIEFPLRNDRERLALAGIMLGLALATKFTGLQAMVIAFAACKVLLWQKGVLWKNAKNLAIAGSLCLALGAPYMIRNTINTGNPVFPFLEGAFHSSEWSKWRADVYANEQASFGVGTESGSRDWSAVGASILGLAYQPGRYINPGQTIGLGYPLGALGIAVLAMPILALITGTLSQLERAVFVCFGVAIALWFVLSQQSRYLIPWVVPLLTFFPENRHQLIQSCARAIVAVQAAYSFVLIVYLFPIPGQAYFTDKLRVGLGQVAPETYQSQKVVFYDAAQLLNKEPTVQRVALYDVVFGYFLDKPYIWANPTHSTLLGEPSADFMDLITALKTQRCSHIAVQIQSDGSIPAQEFAEELSGQRQRACSDETLAAFESDRQIAWKSNLVRALRAEKVRHFKNVGRTVILRLTDT